MADADSDVDALRRDYQSCFGTEAGQRVLTDLEAFTGDSHDLYSENPYDTAFKLGMRRVLLRIRALRREP